MPGWEGRECCSVYVKVKLVHFRKILFKKFSFFLKFSDY